MRDGYDGRAGATLNIDPARFAVGTTSTCRSVAERENARGICYPGATQKRIALTSSLAKLLKTLVAGVGFEPTTFRL